MITIYLSGGLGNQLFQFATAYALSKVKKTNLRINISNYSSNIRSYELNIFENIRLNYSLQEKSWKSDWRILRILKHFFRNSVVSERHPFKYDPSIFYNGKNLNLFGYFQSEKYFLEFRDDILQLLKFPPIADDDIDLKRWKVSISSQNSVSIHVRRGDYISNPQAKKYHGVLPVSYYKKAIDLMKNKTLKPSFFVFTDDPKWVSDNFHFLSEYKLININKGANSFRDIELMSCCKHNIIANSSFSWWGAWINNNQNKIVIAPKRWVIEKSEPLDDIIPVSWNDI